MKYNTDELVYNYSFKLIFLASIIFKIRYHDVVKITQYNIQRVLLKTIKLIATIELKLSLNTFEGDIYNYIKLLPY